MRALVIFHMAKISLTLLWRYSPRGRARKKKLIPACPSEDKELLNLAYPGQVLVLTL